MAKEVVIARLGAQGDGIVETADGPLYVPLALPGEHWRLEGDIAERLSVSPDRAVPPCPHFGSCGGCAVQHLSDELYSGWKRDTVVQAFQHRGLNVEVAPLRRIALNGRRRAQFGVSRTGGAVVLGFREEGQHRLVDMEACVILDPAIVAALPRLRELADLVLARDGPGGRLVVTRLDGGLDVSFDAGAKGLAPETLQQAAAMARRAGIIRLSVGGEPVISAEPPLLTVNGVAVAVPSGLFLQAVAEAEQVMSELVLAATARAKSVVDLFCGLGTFSLALARRARVTAVDGDRRAIAALEAAAKRAPGLKPIAAKVRDLFREPLTQRELDGFDAVVFDPPRAGAQAQCERIAKSKVGTVVAVSCNAATLARDARILIDAGYGMDAVTPIDQFVFSPHVEAVAVFRR